MRRNDREPRAEAPETWDHVLVIVALLALFAVGTCARGGGL